MVGPSGMDTRCWRRLCTAFHSVSSELCIAIALFARHICSSFVSPDILAPFVACCLIALDKQPGVRPIGVCEVVRRLVAKAVLSIIREDIMMAVGPLQLCAGQMAGVEAAIHSVRELFFCKDCDAILMVDASNAFNSLNRVVALHNMRQICPPFATILINIYRSPACLFISGEVLMSEEGTTQGDPLAMPLYALATILLIQQIPSGVEQITSNGCPYLGAAIGLESYIQSFVADKVKDWSEEITILARFAERQPHAAYCAFTHGLSSHWMFVSQTVPFDSVIFQPLEDMILQLFIPTLSGCPPPCDNLRQLFALPARWGGLGIFIPTITSNNELAASRHIAEPLCLCIHDHSKSFIEAISFQQSRKSSVCKAKLDTYSKTSSELCQQLESTLQRAVELASVKGDSNWLTTLPLNEHGFALHKSAFQDALALHYGWPPLRTPTLCACGASFSVDHVLSCPKGGLPSLCHNEIGDLTATLLTEVCSQVCTEPELQPVHNPDEFHLFTSNTQEGACLDIAMNGFWGSRSERCFIDVRVFNPLAPSNSSSLLSSTFKKHENIKR